MTVLLTRLSVTALYALTLMLTLCVCQRSASAQSSASAEALFREGRRASARGDHVAACADYRESNRIEPAVGTLLNIAVCEEALGELADAWQHYREVLSALAAGDTRVALTEARLSALTPRLPWLTVELAQSAPQDAQVQIGSIELPISSYGVAMPWDPGEYELRILAEGRAPNSYQFAIAEGQTLGLRVDAGSKLEPAKVARSSEAPRSVVAAQPSPREPRSFADVEPATTARVISYGALGVGAAALVLSAVTFGLAIDRKSVVDEHCPDRLCDDLGARAGAQGRDLITVSWISLAVGLATGGAGLYGLYATQDAEHVR